MTADEPEKSELTLDTRSLRALAHPLRIRIMDSLRAEGAATSAMLAGRFGENTGTVSWHLRHLAENGFIEEDEGRGTKRERWWKAVHKTQVLPTSQLRKDPAAHASLDVYLGHMVQDMTRKVTAFLAEEWGEEWEGASLLSDWNDLRLTPDRLRDLQRDLLELVGRYADENPADGAHEPGSLPVSVMVQAFPRKEPKDD
ncbi:helix-turn-helix transcriptional regulator [Streptomyces sp. VRA16 Mangrove soil]|uniref:ArsR/SmtB family transcription factor n=1 Tax=Streptomyces sp. VRA16 Mangrove soil TaxID=2817434 RepID=UPI001A9FEE43|nr:helix-turn-helix domain-containing protein [Streptomyces sp. VRA16 Mangrove soil]MBO1336905.1 helix-turn-helix transcriptional regulator [Streptomyces sp. VRA16 Mangrove soil]